MPKLPEHPVVFTHSLLNELDTCFIQFREKHREAAVRFLHTLHGLRREFQVGLNHTYQEPGSDDHAGRAGAFNSVLSSCLTIYKHLIAGYAASIASAISRSQKDFSPFRLGTILSQNRDRLDTLLRELNDVRGFNGPWNAHHDECLSKLRKLFAATHAERLALTSQINTVVDELNEERSAARQLTAVVNFMVFVLCASMISLLVPTSNIPMRWLHVAAGYLIVIGFVALIAICILITLVPRKTARIIARFLNWEK